MLNTEMVSSIAIGANPGTRRRAPLARLSSLLVLALALVPLACDSSSQDGTGGKGGDGGSGGIAGDGGSGNGGSGNGGAAGNEGGAAGEGGSGGGSTIPSDAQTDGGSTLCETLGWCQIINTKLVDICPDPSPGGGGCEGVVSAWSGAAADMDNNLLYMWGGGHNDYYGNEVYVLDLNTLKMKRLNEPSPEDAVTFCDELYSDGLPASRHTYGGLTFLPVQKKLFAYGGSLAMCGPFGDDTLLFDPGSLSWSRPHADGPPAAAPGAMADFDPVSGKVYLHDSSAAFYSFDPANNSYKLLRDNAGVDYHMTGRIDPSRKVFVMMGGGMIRAISLAPGSDYEVVNWDSETTGCEALQNVSSPGLAYDPDQDRLVGWAGGGDVYLFDATTKTCTKKAFPGGPPSILQPPPDPPSPAQPNGTFGRFRYFPKLKVFAVVNDAAKDAYTLRMIP